MAEVQYQSIDTSELIARKSISGANIFASEAFTGTHQLSGAILTVSGGVIINLA